MSKSQLTPILAFFACLCAMFLPGCVTTLKTRDAVVQKMSTNYDDYEKATTYSTPRFYKPNDNLFANEIGHNAYLKCFADEQAKQYSIILRVIYNGRTWAFLDRATDSEGTRLKAESIGREIISGDFLQEYINIDLDHTYLKKHSENGLDIKISGNRGSMILKYPPQYVQGFLDYIDQNLHGYREY